MEEACHESPPWGKPAGHGLAIRLLSASSSHLHLVEGTLSPFIHTLTHLSVPYTASSCGHGGTRYNSTSLRLHTRSVNPAAIAGVQDRHCLAEPVPLVGRDWGRGWRKLACGKQKLVKSELLTQPVLALAERCHTPPARGDMLANTEVEAFNERGVDLPAAGR